MMAQKWGDLAQRVGQQFAATLGEQPVVQSLWVSTNDDGVELWVVTAPTDPAGTRCLWVGSASFQDRFPEAEIRLHVLNRRNYPTVDLDDMLAERAHLITRFADAG